MSKTKPEPRIWWECTVTWTSYATVTADTEAEAIIKAGRDAHPEGMGEVEDCRQISGPPPFAAAALRLADGRTVTVPTKRPGSMEPRLWFPIGEAPGEWWTDGAALALLAEAPAAEVRNTTRAVRWVPVSKQVAAARAQTATVGAEVTNPGIKNGIVARRLTDGEVTADVDSLLLPLVWCPETGTVPRLGANERSLVTGWRDGQCVAAVMPVRL